MQNPRFPLGTEFPYEGFVQLAIESHFRELGFIELNEGRADLVCMHPETNEKWIVEAKGKTQSITVDFNTGMGQLLKKMENSEANYGLAIPKISSYIRQIQ